MSDLLHPPSLARTLKDAAAGRITSSSAAVAEFNPDADDAAATRAALEVCEKTAALLRSQLLVDTNDETPSAKRRAVEREGTGTGTGTEKAPVS